MFFKDARDGLELQYLTEHRGLGRNNIASLSQSGIHNT